MTLFCEIFELAQYVIVNFDNVLGWISTKLCREFQQNFVENFKKVRQKTSKMLCGKL